jgi:polar amino acid transport system substrate-binding protein
MADSLPGYRLLDGRWGAENLAIAVPKGRTAGMAFLRQFAQDAQASGRLQSMVTQAGLRGTTRPE